MRLRKIGLGNPHVFTNGYDGLFFPRDASLLNALGMYFDQVSDTEKREMQEHFKKNYRFSYSSDEILHVEIFVLICLQITPQL